MTRLLASAYAAAASSADADAIRWRCSAAGGWSEACESENIAAPTAEAAAAIYLRTWGEDDDEVEVVVRRLDADGDPDPEFDAEFVWDRRPPPTMRTGWSGPPPESERNPP